MLFNRLNFGIDMETRGNVGVGVGVGFRDEVVGKVRWVWS